MPYFTANQNRETNVWFSPGVQRVKPQGDELFIVCLVYNTTTSAFDLSARLGRLAYFTEPVVHWACSRRPPTSFGLWCFSGLRSCCVVPKFGNLDSFTALVLLGHGFGAWLIFGQPWYMLCITSSVPCHFIQSHFIQSHFILSHFIQSHFILCLFIQSHFIPCLCIQSHFTP